MRARICWILCFLALSTVALAEQEAYPWLPGYRKAPEPVFPEIFMSPEEAAPLLESGEMRLWEPDRGYIDGIGLVQPLRQLTLRGCADAETWCRRKGLRGDESILLVQGSGGREEMAAWFWWLERVGFGRVLVLDGSIDVLAGQLPPQGFAAAPVDSFEFLALCRDSLSISADSLMWKLGEPGTEILDLRGDEAWQAGHIPQALSFDMDEYLPAEGWPDPREARKLLSLFGPRDRDPVDLQAVFVICGHHSWNAEPYLAWMLLKMMGVKARVLDGGFSQWREWGDRPVVRIVDDDEVVEFLEQPDEPPILLDLRGHRDWRRSHIPGSVCLPAHVFADSLETVLEEHWPGADRGRRPMILYCYGADCVRSRNGATLAARAGFLKLLWYRDGIEGWRAAGRPVEP